MARTREREPGKIVGHVDRKLMDDRATIAYVDAHLAALQRGILKHAVVSIVNSPPANPTPGSVYIIGKSPTGDFAGKTGRLAIQVPGFNGAPDTWAEIAPSDKEQRLIESLSGIYQYVAATNEWVEVAQAPAISGGGSTTKLFQAVINDAPAAPVICDFGSASWKTATLTGNLEVRNGPSHVVFNLLGADGVPRLTQSACIEADISLTYAQSVSSRNGKEAIMFYGDDYGLSWLPGPGYNNNDRIASSSHCYPFLRMTLQYMYDGYLIIDYTLSYKAFSNLWYSLDSTYVVNATAQNTQKIIFKPRENARIAFNGSVTYA